MRQRPIVCLAPHRRRGGATTAMPNRAEIAVVFLQPDCNMYCRFCVTEDGFDCMPFATATALLSRLREQGVRTVTLGGGEPFAWPHDLLALAAHGKQLGFCMQVGSNGVALPEGFASLACFDRFVLPLESVDAEPHDHLRRWRGGHHRIIQDRLAELQRHGKTVTVSTVVTAANQEGVPALARFLADYHRVAQNVHAWHLYQLLPFGRGGARNGAELEVPAAIYQQRCDEVQAMALPFRVYRRADMYHSKTVDFYWSQRGEVVCGADAWSGDASRCHPDREG
jgi:MoaA/NifB/PqqE/SkfB family radical SAM enzyme